jgi:hypothetical protein
MPNDFAEPRLEHLFDMHADLETQTIGQTPSGMRQIFIIKGGTISGPSGKGEVLSGGGDWAIVRSDGALQLDVRATVKMDDGALIYVTYAGILAADPPVFARILSGDNVSLAEYYFYTNPMFQTADEHYAWMNKIIAVARGRALSDGVDYRVWALRNPSS